MIPCDSFATTNAVGTSTSVLRSRLAWQEEASSHLHDEKVVAEMKTNFESQSDGCGLT